MPGDTPQRPQDAKPETPSTQGSDRTEHEDASRPREQEAGIRMSQEATERAAPAQAIERSGSRTLQQRPDSLTNEYPPGMEGHGLKPGKPPSFQLDSQGVVSFRTADGAFERVGENRWHNAAGNYYVDAFVSEKNGTLSITHKIGGKQEIYTPQGTVIHRNPDGTVVEQLNNADSSVVRTRDFRGNENRFSYDPKTQQLTRIVTNGTSADVLTLPDGRPQMSADKNTGALIYEGQRGGRVYHNLDGTLSSLPRISALPLTNVEYGADMKPARVTYPDLSTFESKYDKSGHLESFKTRDGVAYSYDKNSKTYKAAEGREVTSASCDHAGGVSLTYKDGNSFTFTPDGHVIISDAQGPVGRPRRITPAGRLFDMGEHLDGNSRTVKNPDGSSVSVADRPTNDGSPPKPYVKEVSRGDHSEIEFGYGHDGSIRSMTVRDKHGHVDEYYQVSPDSWEHVRDGRAQPPLEMQVQAEPKDGTVYMFERSGGTAEKPVFDRGRVLRPDGTRLVVEAANPDGGRRMTHYGVDGTKSEITIKNGRSKIASISGIGDNKTAEEAGVRNAESGRTPATAPPLIDRLARRTEGRFGGSTATAPMDFVSAAPADIRDTTSGGYEISSRPQSGGDRVSERELRSAEDLRPTDLARMKEAVNGAELSPQVRKEAMEMLRLAEDPQNKFAREALVEVHTKCRIGKTGAAAIGIGTIGLALAGWYAVYKFQHAKEAYIPPAKVK